MAQAPLKPPASPLDQYTIHTVAYKTVGDLSILVDISLPVGLPAGSHLIIINWHGGALVTGSRNFVPFYPPWLPPFALSTSAIVVSPDYRLLPESPVSDLISDLDSFWVWLRSSFPSVLATLTSGTHTADLTRILLNGGPAGGWCAMYQALSYPEQIRAVMLQYPGMKNRGELSAKQREAMIADLLPKWTEERFRTELGRLREGKARTEGGWDRMNLARVAKAYGELHKWGGTGKQKPMERVREGARLPGKIWIIHGESDKLVLPEDSKILKGKIEEFCPETEVKLQWFPGDHGFDMFIDPKELEEGLAWVKAAFV